MLYISQLVLPDKAEIYTYNCRRSKLYIKEKTVGKFHESSLHKYYVKY